MQRRTWIAVALALALTGSALAAERLQRQAPAKAEAVQQHSVFLELIIEEEDSQQKIVPRGAVVGIIAECQRVSDFDNAVLWFNDQFLFGHKRNGSGNVTPASALGPASAGSDPAYSDCYVPDGFAHVVEDGRKREARAILDLEERLGPASILEYEESYYISDPNGATWIVDRLSWGPGDVHDTEMIHCPDCPEFRGGTIFTVHLQTDPTTGAAFSDGAQWAYRDGTLRQGLPANESIEDDPDTTGDERLAVPSVDYDFLVAVEFDAFERSFNVEHGEGGADDGDRARDGNAHPYRGQDDEHRNDDGRCVEGGDNVSDVGQRCDENPQHRHRATNLEVFYNATAPTFVERNRYWGEYGGPPDVNEDCSQATSGSSAQQAAIEARNFDICDRSADRGFHAHNGSQTIRPS